METFFKLWLRHNCSWCAQTRKFCFGNIFTTSRVVVTNGCQLNRIYNQISEHAWKGLHRSTCRQHQSMLGQGPYTEGEISLNTNIYLCTSWLPRLSRQQVPSSHPMPCLPAHRHVFSSVMEWSPQDASHANLSFPTLFFSRYLVAAAFGVTNISQKAGTGTGSADSHISENQSRRRVCHHKPLRPCSQLDYFVIW